VTRRDTLARLGLLGASLLPLLSGCMATPTTGKGGQTPAAPDDKEKDADKKGDKDGDPAKPPPRDPRER
jgi:hypothetical protein